MHAGPSQDKVHRAGAGLRGVAITGCTIEDLGGEGISMADPHAQDVRLRPVSDLARLPVQLRPRSVEPADQS